MPRNHPQEPEPVPDGEDFPHLDEPVPSSPPAAERQSTPRILWGIAAVVLLVGAWFGWHRYTAHQEASKTEQLTNMVVQSMQDKFDTDPNFSKYRIHVEKVALIKESANKYDGIATVRTVSGEHDVAIQVTAEGANMMWQAQPGALLFLVQDNLRSLTAPSP